MSGDHNMYQKTKSYLDDFECPRCGHCCYVDANGTSQERVDETVKCRQEPVAWISEGGDVSRSKRYMDEMGFKCNPLYTAPPKQWVGLTDDEIEEIQKSLGIAIHWSDFRAIEAKLREKNT